MKKLIIAAVFLSAPVISASIERNAQIVNGVTQEQAKAAAELVRAFGYRCDSVSAFMPFALSHGFRLTCNNNRYAYELKDVGGRWQVTVK